jgi:DNA-binding SARP family transcriptional activator
LRADVDQSQVGLFDLGKPLAVITYLACAPERSAAREHLIDLLWGDVDPEAAKHALRQTLWYIRKRLGERVLITGGDVLSLVGGVDCDRDHLVDAVTRNDAEAVVRCYTGDFFPGFAAPGGAEFERWADIERQRLRAFFWRSADTLARRWMSAGRLRDAQALARKVRDSDPMREAGWRLLFETLIASGDTVGGALEADAFDRLAAAEGIEPEPATRALHRAVRQPSSVGDGHGDESASLVAELVGREKEFSRLLARWDAAKAGRVAHLHVLAPAGLGKTRLLTDVNARLRATRARTVAIRASLGARDIPFGLACDLAEALAQLPGASGISTGSARTLVALNPALSSSYPAAMPDSAGDSADTLRRRTVAIRELIAAVAEEQPIAIFVDDLQWADNRSRQLVAGVAAALEHVRVMLVTASRPTVDALVPGQQSDTIRLEPLDVAGVGALVGSIAALPSEQWAEQLPADLWNATGGSPLLVLETLQLGMEAGTLIRGESTWLCPRPARLFAALGSGGALRQRVERLDRIERWVMTLLAGAGVPLTRDTVLAAAGRGADETVMALGSLERRGLVARHEDVWSPSHDEIAAMAVDLATDEARRAAAKALGRVLLDTVSGDTRVLRHAGALLAQAADHESLAVAFARFAHVSRHAGDTHSNSALASDFLGERSSSALVKRLVRSLPLHHRSGLYSLKRQVAAAAAVVLLPVGALIGANVVRRPPPEVVLAVGYVTSDSVATVYRVPIYAAQLVPGSTLRVEPTRPKWRLKADPTMGELIRRPDNKAWAIDRVTADSGGIDVFEITDGGRETRLTHARGDDQHLAWSPDGRYAVFMTARWNAESRYDLGIRDMRTGEIHSLTSGEESDASPSWSPDGSRIAFTRVFWDGRKPETCVVDHDGQYIRCFAIGDYGISADAGWYDVNHVFVEVAGGQLRRVIGRLNVETGQVDSLVVNSQEGPVISSDGRWMLCRCRQVGFAQEAMLLIPVNEPNRAIEIDVSRLPPGTRHLVAFESTSRPPTFADSLVIVAGPGAPVVGVPHLLTVRGVSPNGDSVSVGRIRWRSLDTTVATIDSLGLLTPKQPGLVRVEASAGGWRTTLGTILVGEARSAVVFSEDWTRGLDAKWRPFGAPRPSVDTSGDGVPSMLNGGEGSFTSGVYSIAKYSTREGLVVDSWVSVRITLDHWQLVILSLEDAFDDEGL